MKVLIVFILVLASSISAEKLVVADFTKGMNKGLSSTIAGDGYSSELINFDFDPVGALTPRLGFEYLGYGADTSERPITALLGYNKLGDNQLLGIRRHDSILGIIDTIPGNWVDRLVVFKSDGTDSTFNQWYTANENIQFTLPPTTPAKGVHWLGNLFIASEFSEMFYYNGNQIVPVRPLGPGQLQAQSINGFGVLTGVYQYRYNYYDVTNDSNTNFSLPTWPVGVTKGRVYLHGFKQNIADSINYDKIRIWRDDLSDTLGYFLMGEIAYNDTDWTNFTNGFTTEPPYPWGYASRCYWKFTDCQPDIDSTFLSASKYPPGAPLLTVSDFVNNYYTVGDLDTSHSPICNTLEYSIVFVDSAGRWSWGSPTFCLRIPLRTDGIIDSLKVALTNIPIPKEPHSIIKKYLLRRHGRDYVAVDSVNWDPHEDDGFYLIDTLDVDSTTFTDSIRIDSAVNGRPKFCSCSEALSDSTGTDLRKLTCYAGYEPHLYDCRDKNLLAIQPSDIVIHKNRMFAIGDPLNRNTLYYSEFYNPTSWPFDKSLLFQSGLGDWFVKLHVLGEDLIMFRQNSIQRLSGVSFFQFRATSLSGAVGATSARSVAGNEAEVYFAHTTGIFKIVPGSVPQKISMSISNLWDSLTTAQVKEAVGAMKDGEYWLSYPDVDSIRNKTLIYHPLYNYWRTYDYPFDNLIQYSVEASRYDFDPNVYIMSSNDSIFEFSDTTFVGTDATGLIVSTWKSKPLFEGPGRTKVNYIDIEGWGPTPDSIRLLTYQNTTIPVLVPPYTGDTVGGSVVPDWTNNPQLQTRIVVDAILKDVVFELVFYTSGTTAVDKGDRRFRLKTIEIDHTPWDGGKL